MRFFLLFALVFNSVFVKAQLFNKFEQGYYYDVNDHKITGKIAKDASARNAFTSKNYILFKTDTASVRISPDMMKSFVVGLDSFTVSHGSEAQFYEVIIDGPSKIFSVSSFSSSPGMMVPLAAGGMGMSVGVGGGVSKSTNYFYGPDVDHLLKMTRKNYVEAMSLAVADEAATVGLINDKIFHYGDVRDLAVFYNHTKSKKKALLK